MGGNRDSLEMEVLQFFLGNMKRLRVIARLALIVALTFRLVKLHEGYEYVHEEGKSWI
jgi:hypothetical protein